MSIQQGKLVLLCDYSEGHKKMQVRYKDQEFIISKRLSKPNVCDIKPVNSKGPEQVVNQ